MEIEKVEKLVDNLHDKTEYVIHKQILKQALNYGLVFKKLHRVIKFNQNAWLKPYIDVNTGLRKKKQKMILKDFLKLMNNAVFGKTMENVRKIEMLNLHSRKKKKLSCQNQIIMLLSFSQKIY